MSSVKRFDDASISGMLKGFLSYGFSKMDCLRELIDNVLDSQANIVNINLKKCGNKHFLLTYGNGNGLTKDALIAIQQLCSWKNSSTNIGRYGHGYSVSRSVLSNNKGMTTMLSCHTDLTEQEKEDPFSSGKYSQIKIDMEQSIDQNRIVKEPSDEISRANEKVWINYAIEPYKTGTILQIEIPESTYNILESDFSSSSPKKNIRLEMSRNNSIILKNGITINFNGIPIKPLPFPNEDEFYKRVLQIDDCKIDDEAFPPKAVTKCDEILIYQKDENGNEIEHSAIYKGRRNRGVTKISDLNNVSNRTNIAEVASMMIPDVKKYFINNSAFWDELGIQWRDEIGNINQNLQQLIIEDLIIRNNKFSKIDPDTERPSGNKDKYRCKNDVINIIKLNPDVEESKKNDIDMIFGININKGQVYRRDLKKNLEMVFASIKTLVNSRHFMDELIKDGIVKSKKPEEVVDTSSSEVSTDEENEEVETEGTAAGEDQENEDIQKALAREFEKMLREEKEQKADAIQAAIVDSNEEFMDEEEEEDEEVVSEKEVEVAEVMANKFNTSVEEDEGVVSEEEELLNTSPISVPRRNTTASSGICREVAMVKLDWIGLNLSNEQKAAELQGLTRIRNELFTHILGKSMCIIYFLKNICVQNFDGVLEEINNYYKNQYDSTTVVSGGTTISQIYDNYNDN